MKGEQRNWWKRAVLRPLAISLMILLVIAVLVWVVPEGAPFVYTRF